MYKEYILERQGCDSYESEEGFVTYRLKDSLCHVHDFYIKKEIRGKNLSYKLAREFETFAKEKGCEQILTHIDLSDSVRNHENLKVALRYGFRLIRSSDNCLYFIKDI